MKLTKLRALEICKELWVWMRDSGATHPLQKGHWRGWGRYGMMDSNCPCCEYAAQHLPFCDNCPLLSLWGERSSGSCFPCMNESSPYLSFHKERGTPTDARRIIDACDEEIEKLKMAGEVEE